MAVNLGKLSASPAARRSMTVKEKAFRLLEVEEQIARLENEKQALSNSLAVGSARFIARGDAFDLLVETSGDGVCGVVKLTRLETFK